MKKILLSLILMLMIVNIAHADFLGIVNRARDTLPVPFMLIDSIGNPVSLADGDSVYIQVVAPSGGVVYRDSMAYNDASIDYSAWEDFAGGQIYTYTEIVSVLDGSSTTEGIYAIKIWGQDLTSAALVNGSYHTFQMVNSTLEGSLDSAAFAQKAIDSLADALDSLETMSTWLKDSIAILMTNTATSNFVDSAGLSRIVGRKTWGIAAGVGDDSSTVAQRTVDTTGLAQGASMETVKGDVANIDGWAPILDNDSLIIDQSSIEDLALATRSKIGDTAISGDEILAEVVNIDAWNPITDNDSLIVDQSSLEDMVTGYSTFDPTTDSVTVDGTNFAAANGIITSTNISTSGADEIAEATWMNIDTTNVDTSLIGQWLTVRQTRIVDTVNAILDTIQDGIYGPIVSFAPNGLTVSMINEAVFEEIWRNIDTTNIDTSLIGEWLKKEINLAANAITATVIATDAVDADALAADAVDEIETDIYADRADYMATGFSTHSAADVYTTFTAGSAEDVFKADVDSINAALADASIGHKVWVYDTSATVTGGATASYGTYIKDTSAFQGGASGLTASDIWSYNIPDDTTAGSGDDMAAADLLFRSGDTTNWLNNGSVVISDTNAVGDTIAVMPNEWVADDSTAYQGAASGLDSSFMSRILGRKLFGIDPGDGGSDSIGFASRVTQVGGMNTGVITSTAFATDAITSTAIATAAIGATELASNCIGESELAANCITSSEIASGAIDADAIATDAIGALEIATGAIDADAIAAAAITSSELGDAAITAIKIAPDAIGASELADDAIAEIARGTWSIAGSDDSSYTAGTMGKEAEGWDASSGGSDTTAIKTMINNNWTSAASGSGWANMLADTNAAMMNDSSFIRGDSTMRPVFTGLAVRGSNAYPLGSFHVENTATNGIGMYYKGSDDNGVGALFKGTGNGSDIYLFGDGRVRGYIDSIGAPGQGAIADTTWKTRLSGFTATPGSVADVLYDSIDAVVSSGGSSAAISDADMTSMTDTIWHRFLYADTTDGDTDSSAADFLVSGGSGSGGVGGSGTYTCTFYVSDTSTAPDSLVADVRISVYNMAGSFTDFTTLSGGYAKISGNENDTLIINGMRLSGYQFDTPDTIFFADSNFVDTAKCFNNFSSSKCLVYANLKDMGYSDAANVLVTVKLLSRAVRDTCSGSTILVDYEKQQGYADANGYIEFYLTPSECINDKKYQVTFEYLGQVGQTSKFTCPNQTSYDLYEAMP